MKANEIRVGQTYIAMVSGKLVPVRVTAENERLVAPYSKGVYRRYWTCINTATGRKITVRSAQRFRRPASPGWWLPATAKAPSASAKHLCPVCERDVAGGAPGGKLATHGPGPAGEFICPGSGDAAMVAAAAHLNVNDL